MQKYRFLTDFEFNYMLCKLLESYWLGVMQLIRNCMGEVHEKPVIFI